MLLAIGILGLLASTTHVKGLTCSNRFVPGPAMTMPPSRGRDARLSLVTVPTVRERERVSRHSKGSGHSIRRRSWPVSKL